MPQGPFLRKYAVETTINFTLFEVDGVDLRVDASDAGSDCREMRDEGSVLTCANDFTDEGNSYSLVLTASELTAARIVVYVIDSATKEWLDETITIETYGNASAMHAMDFDTAVPAMVGTDDAAHASTLATLSAAVGGLSSAVAAIPTTMVGTDDAAWASTLAVLSAAVGGLSSAVAAIPTTMVGTNNAALAAHTAQASLVALESTIGIPTLSTIASDLVVIDAYVDGVETTLAALSAAVGGLSSVVAAIPTTAMRGTDNAAHASTLATMSAAVGGLSSAVAAIPTTTMRGTDDAAHASTLVTLSATVGGLSSAVATILTGTPTLKYMGYYGPGVYIDSGAANETTVVGTDGTINNPVSTFAAARTIAGAIGLNRYYLEGNSDITLGATHVDWEFCGVGAVADNTLNLGSQDVSRSRFCNLTLEGTQGGSGRIEAIECALQDPGTGATILHIFALRCGIVDDISVDTSNDNVFEGWYSLVAGSGTPIIRATGSSGTIAMRHGSGGVELATLSASHNVSVETDGQVIFNADCNRNANVSVRGNMTITDNTAGMNNLTQDAAVNMLKINAGALQTDWADGGRLDLLLDAIKVQTDDQPAGIPKNVALPNFPFVMLDSTDHVTPKTGLTITEEIKKDAGSFAACANTFTSVINGVYMIDFTQAEMNADIVTLKFTASGADGRIITIITSA